MKKAVKPVVFIFVLVYLFTGCKKEYKPCGSKELYEITGDSALLHTPDSIWIEISNTSGKVQGTYLFQKQNKIYWTSLLRDEGNECPREARGKAFSVSYRCYDLNDSFTLGYIQDKYDPFITFLYNGFYYKGWIDRDSPGPYHYFGLIIKDSLYNYYDSFCIDNDFTNYSCQDYHVYHNRTNGFLQAIIPQSNTVLTRVFK